MDGRIFLDLNWLQSVLGGNASKCEREIDQRHTFAQTFLFLHRFQLHAGFRFRRIACPALGAIQE